MSPQPAASGRVLFPETAWTRVLEGRSGDAQATARALDELCRQYWPAIYSYVRALGLVKEEAEDASQDFVAQFMLGDPLQRADPERGRLRSYIKQSVRNFLAKRQRDASRQKRGGGLAAITLDEAESIEPPATAAAPDEAYDREWAWTVMARAMTSLRESYAARGRQAVFDLIKPSLAGGDALQPYAAIGLAAGVSEAQIKLEVHRARRRLADALRREVASTVAAESEVDAELRYLLTVLTHE